MVEKEIISALKTVKYYSTVLHWTQVIVKQEQMMMMVSSAERAEAREGRSILWMWQVLLEWQKNGKTLTVIWKLKGYNSGAKRLRFRNMGLEWESGFCSVNILVPVYAVTLQVAAFLSVIQSVLVFFVVSSRHWAIMYQHEHCFQNLQVKRIWQPNWCNLHILAPSFKSP